MKDDPKLFVSQARVPYKIQGSGHRTEGQLPSPGDSSVRRARAALGHRVERGGDGQAAAATCLCFVHSLPIGWHFSGTPPCVQDPGLVARLPAGLQGGVQSTSPQLLSLIGSQETQPP